MKAPDARSELQINKLPDGGFTVGETYRREGFYPGPLFACTDIGEALAYIKKALTQGPAVR